jgi:threonine dehydrogenase-like Zn-dependent dehydrogenase
VNAITPCYACENCQRGSPSQCGGLLGGWKFANLKDGSMAEYFHVNDALAMMATVGARLCGAGLVIGVESKPNRAAMAKKYGADAVVDYTKEDPVEAIRRHTRGKGVDNAIGAQGSPPTLSAVGKATRPRRCPSPASSGASA